MKRKLLLFALIISALCVPKMQAQTLFYEGFEDGSIPSGWTQSGSGTWTVATGVYSPVSSAYAGTKNAMISVSSYSNQTQLITPVIDLSGKTSVVLTFAYANVPWDSDIDKIKVYYRSTSTDSWHEIDNITTAHTSWTEAEYTLTDGLSATYQLCFEMNGAYGRGVGLDEVTIVPAPSCVSLKTLSTTTTRTSVTANWTLKGDTVPANCEGYEVKLTATNNPDTTAIQSVTIDNPATLTYTFNNLDRETTYYVHVRSNCGNDDGYSAWVSASATTGGLLDCDNPDNVIQAADGTATNKYVPVYGNYADSQQKSQSIYPASMLTDLVGKPISKLKYYVESGSSANWSSAVFNIRMMETTATTLNAFLSTTDATLVYNGTLSASVAGGMEINLTTPFTYNGSNLLIEFEIQTKSSYCDCYFYGISATGASYENYSNKSGTTYDFLPKVDFGYCEQLEACPAVTNLSADSIDVNSAVINWTASTGDYVGSYDLLVSDTAVADLTLVTPNYTGLTTTTKTLDTLAEYSDYYVYVRVNCNGYGKDDGAAWSEGVHFQTLSPCNVPTNLSVDLLGKTSAVCHWTTTPQPNNYSYILSDSVVTDLEQLTPTAKGIFADSALLTGLTPGTTYYLYLSNKCGKSLGSSPWVSISFTTPNACLDPDTVYASDIQKYQITLNWVPNQFTDSTDTYDVLIDTVQVTDFASVTPTATGVTGTSYTFDTLYRNTLYYMYVRVNCGEGGATNWLETTAITDSIAPDCQEKQAGSGTSSNYNVGVKYYDNYGYGQTLIDANELGDNPDARKGTITSISFDVAQTSSYSANWKIYLGHTPNSSLTSWVDYSSLTEVATKTGPFTTGWYTIELTTPFEYNGIDNLVVAIANQTGNYSDGYYLRFRYESKYSPYMSYIRGGSASYYGDPTNTTKGNTSGSRMNMKFNICNPADVCPVIDLVTIPAEKVLDDQALITWTPGTGDFTSSYNIIVAPYQVTKPDSTFIFKPEGVVVDSNLVDTFYLATGLTPETKYYVYVRANCKLQPYDDGSSNWKLVEPAFITEKACVKPFAFQITGATSTTMSLQWLNRKNASNWLLGINDSTVNVTLSDDTCRYTVTDLTPNTEYTFTLRSICTVGDTSDVVTLPGSYYQRTLNNETNINVLAIPNLELIPDTIVQDTLNHTISATFRKGSDLTNVRIEYDRSDYVSKVTSSSGNMQGNYGDLNLTTPNTLTVVAEDTLIRQDWTINPSVEPCATPYNVAAANVSRRTADLTWNIGDSVATSFDVVVSTTELEDPSTGTVQTVTATNVDGACTYALTDLSRETTYYAYVRTNCGTEFGQWRGKGFTTMGTNDCEDITLGSNSASSNFVPARTNYNYAYNQQIYTAAEIGEAGSISGISLENNSSGYSPTRTIDIYMMHTTKSSFANGNDYLVPTASNKVYSGSVTYSNWTDITFQTPFAYNGTDNVVLIIDDNTGSSYFTGVSFAGNNMSDNKTLYLYSDDDNYSPSSPGTMNAMIFRNHAKFNICNVADLCPEVADLTVTNILTNAATITWTATGDYPGTSDIYVVTGDTTGLAPSATGITGSSYTATGLTAYTDYTVYVRTHCNGEGQDDGVSPWVTTTFKSESECEYPRNVEATVTGKNSVHISWTDAQGLTPTTAYEYAYSTEETEPTSGTTSKTGSADITGLTANTTYYVYVRKVGGAGIYSPWIKANEITTPAAMPAPIIEETYDISFNAFRVRWTRDYEYFANETQWQYACVASGETPSAWTTTTDTIAIVYGLTESTTYDFCVRATDGSNNSETVIAEVTTSVRPSDCMTIGNGVNKSYAPICARYGYERHIYLFTPADGLTDGTIQTLAWNMVTADKTVPAKIYLKNTTETDLSTIYTSGSFNTAKTGATLVYDATFTSVAGWNTIDITDFDYTGGNLMVLVESNKGGDGGATIEAYNTEFGSNNHVFVKNDDSMDDNKIISTYGGSSSISLDNKRHNIQFCFAPQTCPKPTHLVVDNITTTGARVSWYPGNTETEWRYYVATEELTDSALNTKVATTTTTLVNALSGLNADIDYHFYVKGNCSATESSKWAHVAFITLPTCSAPINAVAVSTADNQITFDAAAGTYGTVGSYDFRYWRVGTTDTVTVADQTATCVATNVTGGDYDWQVRANCGTTDGMSRWTAGNCVRVCGTHPLPYAQGFEEVPTSYTGPGMIETICWNDLNATVNLSYTPTYKGYNGYHSEGNRALMLTQGNVDTLYLILPSFGDAENLCVKFDASMNSTSAPNRIKVGYITDITDESTFVPVYTAANTSNFTSNTAYIRNLPAGARLAFSYDDSEYGITQAYLDNIRVDTVSNRSLATSVAPDANFGSVEMTCQASDTTADGRFYDGTTPTLKAVATQGYHFANWTNANTGDTISYEEELTVLVEQDTALVANFVPNKYSVNVVVSSEEGQEELGDVSGSGIYDCGTNVIIKATNISAYYHVVWSDGNTDNPRQITVPAKDTTIVATFVNNLITGVTTSPYKGKYDGTAHNVTVSGTIAGDSVTYSTDSVNWVASFDRIDVSATKVFVKVARANYSDYVTSDSIVISKRSVTLTSANATKSYNGTALTNDTVTVTGDNWAQGEGATYTVTGSQTTVGSSKNLFTYTLTGATAKPENYKVDTVYGTLTVKAALLSSARIDPISNQTYTGDSIKPDVIVKYDTMTLVKDSDYTVVYSNNVNVGQAKATITGKGNFTGSEAMNFTIAPATITGINTTSYKGKYDGTSHSLTVSGTLAGDDVKYSTDSTNWEASLSRTDASATKVFVKVARANYNDYVTTDSIVISKRAITMTSSSAEKSYDGTPLTNDTINVTGDGWVSGEGATYNVTGTQTAVGNSQNLFTYTLTGATAKADNYSIEQVNGTLTVTQNTTLITITASDSTKTYDGTALTQGASTYTGTLAQGDVLTATTAGTITDFGTAVNTIASYKIVNPDKADVTSFYSNVQMVNGTLTINKRQLTVSGTAVSDKIYDGTTTAINKVGAISGLVGGEQVNVTANADFDTKNVGQGKNVTVTYALDNSAAAKNYIAPESEVLTASISSKQLTIEGTVVDRTKVYDGNTVAEVTADGSLVGVVTNDKVNVMGSATYADAQVGEGKQVTVTYDIYGDDADNYLKPADATITAAITSKALTISGTQIETTKVYDGSTTAKVVANGTLSGVLKQDVISVEATAEYDTKNVGETKTVAVTYTIAGEDAANYTAPQQATLTAAITPIALTVSGTTVASEKIYDGNTTAQVLSAGELNGVLDAETVNISATAAYADKNIGTAKSVALTYAITGADAGNYTTPADATTTADITAKQLTVSGTTVTATKEYDGTTDIVISDNGTLSGVIGEENVALSAAAAYTDKNIGDNKQVAVTYTISGADAANYLAPNNDTKTATITAKSLTIIGTTVESSKVYDGTTDAKVTVLGAVNGIVGQEAVSVTATATYADKNVGEDKAVAVVYTLTGADAANYIAPQGSTLKAAITAAPLTVSGTVVESSKVYDATTTANITSVGTLNGVCDQDVVSIAATAQYITKNVGQGKSVTVSYTITGANASNYTVPANMKTTADITPATLTVTGSQVEGKIYDGNTVAKVTNKGTLDGVIGQDKVTLLATAAFSDKNAGEGKTVTITYELEGVDYDNYNAPEAMITTANINQAKLEVIGTNIQSSKVYDGTDACVVTTVGKMNGLHKGDDVTCSATAVYSDVHAGIHNVDVTYTLSGADAANFIVPENITLRSAITPKPLTISGTAIATTKVFDGTTAAEVKAVGISSGILEGDMVIVSATATYDDPSVGEGKPVTVTYSLSGMSADDYYAPDNITLYADITSSGTGVDDVNANVRIYVIGYELYVEGLTGDYTIYSTTGQLIYTGDAAQYTLPQTGNYLVRYQGGAVKVQAKH